MKIEFPATRFVLATDQFIKLEGAVGVRISSRRGSVWITQDGDIRDVVLEPGEAFVIERAGPSIVQALEPAELAIVEPKQRSRAAHWADRARSLITAVRLALGARPGHSLQADA